MNRKVEDSTDGGRPCWENYPPVLTIAQAAQIMEERSIRRVSEWLSDAGLIGPAKSQRRVDKANLRRCLESVTDDERNGRTPWN